MAKAKASLEEGLDRSANKKGLTGKARHRYVGGAIRNMEKRGEFTIKRKPAATKASTTTRKAPTPKPIVHHKAPEPPKPRVKLVLVVKKNPSLSTSTKTVYSVYNEKTGTKHGTFASTKRAAAVQEANNEMYAYNHPKGIHTRNRLA